METDGGGWIVFQRRMDGSRDFYLDWKNYDLGFGRLEEEFWLGLNTIHRLTPSNVSLRVDLEDFDGNRRFAQYSTFSIGNALTQYNLTVCGYTGNAGDSMAFHNGMKFSTKDRDNDHSNPGSCAIRFKGGWWYRDCHNANLNGRYLFGPITSYADGVIWYHWKGHYYSLKYSEMKLRRN